MDALILAAELILILLVGFVARKLHIVDGSFTKQLSSFVLNIALPCMIINSMKAPISAERLQNSLWALVAASATLLLGALAGLLLSRVFGKKLPGSILRFGLMYTNFNFFGLVVAERLGGEELLFYYLMYIIPVRVTIYILAKVMLMPRSERSGAMSWGERARLVVSPPLVAVFIGLALGALNITVPTVLQYGLDVTGGLAAPLGIMLCGMTLGGYPVKKMLTGSTVILALLRNLLMPGLALGLCLLLGVPTLLSRMCVMYSALPVASLLGTYVLQYDPDHQLEGAGFVFVSTLFSSVTLVLFVYLMQTCFP